VGNDSATLVLPMRLAKEDEKNKLIKRVSLKGFEPEGFGRHSICATVSSENRKDIRIKKIVALLKEAQRNFGLFPSKVDQR